MKAPSNIKQLRDDLLKVYVDLRNGDVTSQEIKETTNTAKAVIASCKVELFYAKLKGEKPFVKFLETEN